MSINQAILYWFRGSVPGKGEAQKMWGRKKKNFRAFHVVLKNLIIDFFFLKGRQEKDLSKWKLRGQLFFVGGDMGTNIIKNRNPAPSWSLQDIPKAVPGGRVNQEAITLPPSSSSCWRWFVLLFRCLFYPSSQQVIDDHLSGWRTVTQTGGCSPRCQSKSQWPRTKRIGIALPTLCNHLISGDYCACIYWLLALGGEEVTLATAP